LAPTFTSATVLSPETGNDFVDAFINNGRHYVNSDGGSQPVVIPYYFGELTQTAAQAARGVNTPYTWRPFETAAYEKAVLGWEAVANVDFVRTSSQESALFIERLEDQATAGGTVSASHSLPSASATAKSQGTYNFEAVNTRQWTPDNLEPGGNFYRTFIHETGHGLGLKHPHDPGSGAFNPDFFPGISSDDTAAVRQRSLGTLELNHMFGSVMSYLHGYSFDEQGLIDVVATRQRPVADDYFLDHGFAATPMAYDIAAIQYMYGANTNYASGNNVYILPDSNDPHPFVRGEPNEVGVPESIVYQPDTAFWSCLWDTGGIDEMRYDGARNAILDLTAATLDYSSTGYGVLSYAAFIGGGYTIANGVVIENATGGSGDDSLTGNAAANVLTGRAGNDTLDGRAGDDFLDGGAGLDKAIFSYALSDAAINLSSNGLLEITGADGTDTIRGIEQFQFGDRLVNNADASPLVDDLYYLIRNPDVAANGIDADDHYAQSGAREGRDPNAFFSTKGYLAANPDVAASGANPLTQYAQAGWKEGRDPGANFDNEFYLARNPDVKAAGINPLVHYLESGQAEGREIFAAVGRPADIRGGFDAEYYLLANTDVAIAASAAGGDTFAFARQHFDALGWKEGRDPNAIFDTKGYLAAYTDVAQAGVNPLTHYDSIGFKEGRDPATDFDSSAYLANSPDVAQAGYDPLQHYLQFGLVENRAVLNDGTFGMGLVG
jgi:hypothetical protein